MKLKLLKVIKIILLFTITLWLSITIILYIYSKIEFYLYFPTFEKGFRNWIGRIYPILSYFPITTWILITLPIILIIIKLYEHIEYFVNLRK